MYERIDEGYKAGGHVCLEFEAKVDAWKLKFSVIVELSIIL